MPAGSPSPSNPSQPAGEFAGVCSSFALSLVRLFVVVGLFAFSCLSLSCKYPAPHRTSSEQRKSIRCQLLPEEEDEEEEVYDNAGEKLQTAD